MKKYKALVIAFVFIIGNSYAQSKVAEDMEVIPSNFLNRMQATTSRMDRDLTLETERYLERMAKKEDCLWKRLYKGDSAAAKVFRGTASGRYAALVKKLKDGSSGCSSGIT